MASDAELVCDLDGHVLAWSAALDALLGQSAERAMGEPLTSLLSPSGGGAPELAGILAAVRSEGRAEGELHVPATDLVLGVDARRVDAPGPPRVHVRFLPLRQSTPGSEGIRLRILADASRAFADAGLDLDRALDAIVRFVADAIGDACIVRLLADDGVTLVAAAAHHRRVERVAELRDVIMKIPMRADEGVHAHVMAGNTVLANHIDEQAQLRHTQAAARPHVAKMRVSSVLMVPLRARGRALGYLGLNRDPGGAPYGADDRALLEDLADRAAMAIEAARLYAESQRAIALRDEFVAIASHELRTPLTSLLLQLSSATKRAAELDDDPRAQAIRERLRGAESQVRRLGRLVETLLEASRIEAGALRLDPEPLDLAAVVRDVVERFEPDAAKAGCAVEFSVEGTTRGSWDRLRVEHVATNLVANAIKYGQGAPIHVRVVGTGGACELHVVDRGIGMDETQRASIFRRYARGVSSKAFGGFGLGLWIASEMVRAMGGAIAVESAPGEGAHFVVTLPIA